MWGFLKRIAQPKLYIDNTDALVGVLDYGNTSRCPGEFHLLTPATATGTGLRRL